MSYYKRFKTNCRITTMANVKSKLLLRTNRSNLNGLDCFGYHVRNDTCTNTYVFRTSNTTPPVNGGRVGGQM